MAKHDNKTHASIGKEAQTSMATRVQLQTASDVELHLLSCGCFGGRLSFGGKLIRQIADRFGSTASSL